jgi:competence protein ComEC
MAFIALYARASGRTYAAGRALLAVIFLMLLWRPLTLAFDPSFDLSALATAGLIWLSPLVELKLSKIKNAAWRGEVATTVAAQLAVWPLLLYETGNLSLTALPANLLAIAIVPPAMAASAVAGIAGMLLPSLAFIAGFPAYLSTRYLILLAKLAGAVPAIALPAFPFLFVLLAYGALALIALSKRSSTTRQLRLSKKASI